MSKNSQTPLVSVVTITFNHSKWIDRAIESILSQETEFPFELIIGDDCSTDGTRDSVDAWYRRNQKRVRLVLPKTNLGAQRNLAVCERAARGKYIAYCEGDDFWHDKQKLAKQLKVLENRPEIGLVHSDVDALDPISGTLTKRLNRFEGATKAAKPDKLFSAILAHKYRIRTCSVIAHTELIRRVVDSDFFLFESGHFPMGDTTRWLAAAQLSQLHYIDESLATYCLSPGSVSRPGSQAKEAMFYLKILEMTNYLAEKYSLPASETRPILRHLAFDVVMRGFRLRDPSLASRTIGMVPDPGLALRMLVSGSSPGPSRLTAWALYALHFTSRRIRAACRKLQRGLHHQPS
jgi:glycosyltransferase involved in cell wall biosynthesis